MNMIVVAALIQMLTQEVNILQQQLAAMQASSTVAVATTTTMVLATSTVQSTPVVAPVKQTITMSEAIGSAVVPQSISVTFATSSNNEGLLTIKNTLGIPVRIKSLDVNGSLAGFSIGAVYGEGFVYQESFKDSQGAKFDVFTCTGLDSLGKANLGSSGMVDPCVRRDSYQPKNELQPGETMVLRYTGSPTAVTYQAGSITDLAGNDIQF
jgi:hypothetical protein